MEALTIDRKWTENLDGLAHLQVPSDVSLAIDDEVALFDRSLEFTRHRVTATHHDGTVDLGPAIPWPEEEAAR